MLRDDSNRATAYRIDTRVGDMYVTNQHTTNRGGRLSDQEHNAARLLYDDSGTASIGSGPTAITVTYRLRERPQGTARLPVQAAKKVSGTFCGP